MGKWLWTEAWTEANFCNVRIRRNRNTARSRRRNGRCEFSARCCQTNANQSPLPIPAFGSDSEKAAPLGESGVAGLLSLTLPPTLSSVSETPGLSFARLGGLGKGGRRGALRVAQRQAPLRGEGLCEGGGGLPTEAGVWAFGVVVLAPGHKRCAGTELCLPGIERGTAYPVPAADLGRPSPCLLHSQDRDELLFGELRSLHVRSFQVAGL